MEPHHGISTPDNNGSSLTLSAERQSQTPRIQVSPPVTRPASVAMSEGKRKRVGFTSDTTPPSVGNSPEGGHLGESSHSPEDSTSSRPRFTVFDTAEGVDVVPEIPEEVRQDIYAAFAAGSELAANTQPRPVLRKTQQPSVEPEFDPDNDLDGEARERQISGKDAHERAQKLAARLESYNASAAPSRAGSFDLSPSEVSPDSRSENTELKPNRISSEDSDQDVLYTARREKPEQRQRKSSIAQANDEAHRLVSAYSLKQLPTHYDVDESPLHSGQATPVTEQLHGEDYVPRPDQYRGGILSSLIRLQNTKHNASLSSLYHRRGGPASTYSLDELSLAGTTPIHSPGHSPSASGTTTPTGSKHHRGPSRNRFHWPSHHRHGSESPTGIAALVGPTTRLGLPTHEIGHETVERQKQYASSTRPGMKRNRSSEAISSALKKIYTSREKEEYKIKKHIAETIARHKYIVKLCRALMDYGAPTHRLEEYLKMTARVLEIDAQFLYLPGCMIISFDDPQTRTTEVKLVRTPQGVDLGKLRDTHTIYKEVVHDQIHVTEAVERLEAVMKRPLKFPVWFLIIMYGLAALSVGPYAFQARWLDLPLCFVNGCVLGFLQLVVANKGDLWRNIFEILASIITSFLARAFGSIYRADGTPYFCFSAMAQSSIALILPGYTVLCASLELQSRSIIAGSVRLVYAIIYSLFLGYGITIGSAIYGAMDGSATSATTCSGSMDDYLFFIFVPIFTMCLVIVNQAKWKQSPVMLVISFAGYVVNYFASKRFSGNAQVSQTLGALTIGVMANLYARLGPTCENYYMEFWFEHVDPVWHRLRERFMTKQQRLKDSAAKAINELSSAEQGEKTTSDDSDDSSTKTKGVSSKRPNSWRERKGYGIAAAAMLPAIFVQVPSGLAVSGSLVSGVTSANEIVHNSTGTTTISTANTTTVGGWNDTAFTVSYSVIQIAIGITVGLFLSAVIVYPFGKRRSGLFSF